MSKIVGKTKNISFCPYLVTVVLSDASHVLLLFNQQSLSLIQFSITVAVGYSATAIGNDCGVYLKLVRGWDM